MAEREEEDGATSRDVVLERQRQEVKALRGKC